MTDFGFWGVNPDNYEDYNEYIAEVKKRQGFRCEISPDVLVKFYISYAKNSSVKTVYNPWLREGNLAYALRENGFDVSCYDINSDHVKIIEKYGFDYLDLEEESDKSFDLICADLPLGMRDTTQIDKIMEYSANHLVENGSCLFSFADGIVFNKSQIAILERASERGLYANGYIDLPNGAFLPYASVNTKILIFQKFREEKRFIAGIEDISDIETIIYSFLNHQDSKKMNLGKWVNPIEISDYRGYKSRCELIKEQKDFGGEYIELSKVAINIIRPNKENEFEQLPNSVFIPKIGVSEVVLDVLDFHIKAQNYIQVQLDSEKISANYVAFFYNTPKGVEIRRRAMSPGTIPQFNKVSIGALPIIIPGNKVSDILNTYQRINELEVQLASVKRKFLSSPIGYTQINKDLKNINNAETMEMWAETLPFPLASVLLRYSTDSSFEKKKYDLMLFFEGFALFHACILLSILNENRSVFDSKVILDGTDGKQFERASFGSWVWINSKITSYFRKMYNSGPENKQILLKAFKTEDEELIKILISSDIQKVMSQTNKLRNEWKGHTGVSSEEISEVHTHELEKYLWDIRKFSSDLYTKTELIRSKGMNFAKGIYNCQIEELTGSRTLFKKSKIQSTIPLEDNILYFRMNESDTVIELLPFIIFKNSPKDELNACYFYSKVDNGNTKYISYHFEKEPDDLENGTVAFEAIKSLVD